MKKVKLLSTILSVMLFASSLSGCAHVKVTNEEFCGDKGTLGATCDWTNGGPTTKLNKPQWDQKRFGMACAKVESITRLLGVIKKLCFDTGRCTYEEYKYVEKKVLRMYRKLGLDADTALAELDAMEPLLGVTPVQDGTRK